VFILSSNILALILLNWHTRLLPSHTLYFTKRLHRTITTLLAFCFPTSAVLHFACWHFVQGILFGCTDYMPSLHRPNRSRSLCFIVNHKAICLLSVVILIYSRLLALNNKKLPVCILPPSFGSFVYSDNRIISTYTRIDVWLEELSDSNDHVVYIVVIHEVMQSWSDKGGVCLVCFIESCWNRWRQTFHGNIDGRDQDRIYGWYQPGGHIDGIDESPSRIF